MLTVMNCGLYNVKNLNCKGVLVWTGFENLKCDGENLWSGMWLMDLVFIFIVGSKIHLVQCP